MSKRTLVLIKESVITAHDSHYAGGIHLFNCLARAVTSSQHFEAILLLSTASKAVILHHAVINSLLAQLHTQTLACGAKLVSWQEPQLHHHVVVREQPQKARTGAANSTSAQDTGNSASSNAVLSAAALLAAVDAIMQSITKLGQTGFVVLDVDTLQQAQVPAELVPNCAASEPEYACSSSSKKGCSSCCCCVCQQSAATGDPLRNGQHHRQQQQQQQQQQQRAESDNARQVPFMLALANVLQRQQHHPSCAQAPLAQTRHQVPPEQQQDQQQQGHGMRAAWPLLALVQNIHHLPFGPCGTAPRSPAILQAWRAVAGVMCVSDFVKRYCLQHMVPLLLQLQQQQQPVYAVHPAAFGVWGKGPYEDLGSKAAADIWRQAETEPHQQQQQQQQQMSPLALTSPHHHQQQRGWQRAPVVGMLKLTREKGSELFLSLAAQMPDLQFRAVCADPWVEQQVAQTSGLDNVQLVAPQADVTAALQGMSLLLVPSVLCEAFGMVVLDAMLHGLPVIVAEAGALPEAAVGAAAVVLPVSMVTFPPIQQQSLLPAPPPSGTSATTAAAEARLATAEAEISEGPKAVASANSSSRTLQVACYGMPDVPGDVPLEQPLAAGTTADCVQCWLLQERSWDFRQFPAQQPAHVDSWAAAIRQVLSSRDAYLQASQRSRAAGEQELQQGPAQLSGLFGWLEQLETETWCNS